MSPQFVRTVAHSSFSSQTFKITDNQQNIKSNVQNSDFFFETYFFHDFFYIFVLGVGLKKMQKDAKNTHFHDFPQYVCFEKAPPEQKSKICGEKKKF